MFFLPRPKSPGEHAAWAAVYLCPGLFYLALPNPLIHDWTAFLLPVPFLALGVRHIIAALVQINRWPPDN